MKEELGIAVIGCGRIGITHLEALQDLKKREGGVRLVATVDPEGERAAQCAQKYGAAFHYMDHGQALANSSVDAVVLALPNHLHAAVTIDAADAAKHILVEKPMSNHVEEADSMVAAAQKADVKLMVAHSRRHIKALYTAWEMIDEIGKPLNAVYLTMMRRSDPTPWMEKKETNGQLAYSLLGAHTIDYILWLFKGRKKPVRVYSEGYSNIPTLEGMDEASVIIGFDDGAHATTTISMSNRTPRIERIVVIGTEGSMHMEHAYARPAGSPIVGTATSKLIFNDTVVWDGVQDVWNFTLQMKEFVACIREDRPPISDGRDVRHVIPIVEAADMSAESHQVTQLK